MRRRPGRSPPPPRMQHKVWSFVVWVVLAAGWATVPAAAGDDPVAEPVVLNDVARVDWATATATGSMDVELEQTWMQQAPLNTDSAYAAGFGSSIAVAADTIVVGANRPLAQSNGLGLAYTMNQLPAVLVPNASVADTKAQTDVALRQLIFPHNSSVLVFGSSTVMHPDSPLLAMGSPAAFNVRGAVQLLTRPCGTPNQCAGHWEDASHSFQSTGMFTLRPLAGAPSTRDEFGTAMAMTPNLLAVTAPGRRFAQPVGAVALYRIVRMTDPDWPAVVAEAEATAGLGSSVPGTVGGLVHSDGQVGLALEAEVHAAAGRVVNVTLHEFAMCDQPSALLDSGMTVSGVAGNVSAVMLVPAPFVGFDESMQIGKVLVYVRVCRPSGHASWEHLQTLTMHDGIALAGASAVMGRANEFGRGLHMAWPYAVASSPYTQFVGAEHNGQTGAVVLYRWRHGLGWQPLSLLTSLAVMRAATVQLPLLPSPSTTESIGVMVSVTNQGVIALVARVPDTSFDTHVVVVVPAAVTRACVDGGASQCGVQDIAAAWRIGVTSVTGANIRSNAVFSLAFAFGRLVSGPARSALRLFVGVPAVRSPATPPSMTLSLDLTVMCRMVRADTPEEAAADTVLPGPVRTDGDPCLHDATVPCRSLQAALRPHYANYIGERREVLLLPGSRACDLATVEGRFFGDVRIRGLGQAATGDVGDAHAPPPAELRVNRGVGQCLRVLQVGSVRVSNVVFRGVGPSMRDLPFASRSGCSQYPFVPDATYGFASPCDRRNELQLVNEWPARPTGTTSCGGALYLDMGSCAQRPPPLQAGVVAGCMFQGVESGLGGAIAATCFSELTVSGVAARRTTALCDGSVLHVARPASETSLAFPPTRAVLTGSVVEDAVCLAGAGAVAAVMVGPTEARVLVNDTTVARCTAMHGAAVAATGTYRANLIHPPDTSPNFEVAIAGSSLEDNTAQESGGAVYVMGTSAVRVTASRLLRSAATASGGALSTLEVSNVAIQDSLLDVGTANTGGCAFVSKALALSVSGSMVSNCRVDPPATQAASGGCFRAVLDSESTGTLAVNVQRTAFHNCTVALRPLVSAGAGLDVQGAKLAVTLQRCHFERCTAYSSRASDFLAAGGGVRLIASQSLLVVAEDCTFRSNFAGRGGGLHAHVQSSESATVTLQRCAFIDNSGVFGAAVSVLRAALRILDSELTRNTASRSGGGVFADTSSLVMQRTLLQDQRAFVDGGAAFIQMCFGETGVRLNRVQLLRNRASSGGAISVRYCSTVILEGVAAANNSATKSGGALFINGATDVQMLPVPGLPTTLADNTVTQGIGGALACDRCERLFFSAARFQRNSALHSTEGAGGAILVRDCVALDLLHCELQENGAGVAGGAMAVLKDPQSSLLTSQCRIDLRSSHLGANRAERGPGGAMFLQAGTQVVVSGSLLDDNVATAGGGMFFFVDSSSPPMIFLPTNPPWLIFCESTCWFARNIATEYGPDVASSTASLQVTRPLPPYMLELVDATHDTAAQLTLLDLFTQPARAGPGQRTACRLDLTTLGSPLRLSYNIEYAAEAGIVTLLPFQVRRVRTQAGSAENEAVAAPATLGVSCTLLQSGGNVFRSVQLTPMRAALSTMVQSPTVALVSFPAVALPDSPLPEPIVLQLLNATGQPMLQDALGTKCEVRLTAATDLRTGEDVSAQAALTGQGADVDMATGTGQVPGLRLLSPFGVQHQLELRCVRGQQVQLPALPFRIDTPDLTADLRAGNDSVGSADPGPATAQSPPPPPALAWMPDTVAQPVLSVRLSDASGGLQQPLTEGGLSLLCHLTVFRSWQPDGRAGAAPALSGASAAVAGMTAAFSSLHMSGPFGVRAVLEARCERGQRLIPPVLYVSVALQQAALVPVQGLLPPTVYFSGAPLPAFGAQLVNADGAPLVSSDSDLAAGTFVCSISPLGGRLDTSVPETVAGVPTGGRSACFCGAPAQPGVQYMPSSGCPMQGGRVQVEVSRASVAVQSAQAAASSTGRVVFPDLRLTAPLGTVVLMAGRCSRGLRDVPTVHHNLTLQRLCPVMLPPPLQSKVPGEGGEGEEGEGKDASWLSISSGVPVHPPVRVGVVGHWGALAPAVPGMSVVCMLSSSLVDVSISGSTEAVAEEGVATFHGLSLVATPGSTVQLQLRCLFGGQVLPADAVVQLHVRRCDAGEVQPPSTKTCFSCARGSYSLVAGEPLSSECRPCPPGARCEGGAALTVEDGWWLYMGNGTLHLQRCRLQHACRGVSNSSAVLHSARALGVGTSRFERAPAEADPVGQCATGYTGNLCNLCAHGYWELSSGCGRCPARWVSVLLLLLGVLLFAAVLAFALWRASRTLEAVTGDRVYSVTSLSTSDLPRADSPSAALPATALPEPDAVAASGLALPAHFAPVREGTSSLTSVSLSSAREHTPYAALPDEPAPAKQRAWASLTAAHAAFQARRTHSALVATSTHSMASVDLQYFELQRERHSSVAKLRIVFSYLHMLSLAREVNVDWTQGLVGLFSTQSSMSSFSDRLISLDCLLPASMLTQRQFVLASIILAFPILFLLSCAIWWSWRHRCRSLAGAKFVVYIIVVAFMLQTSLVRHTFLLFACEQLVDGELYLRVNLNTPCSGASHSLWMTTFGAMGVLLYAVGIPAVSLMVLFLNRHRLPEPRVVARFGFLFLGYRPKTFYWEVAVMVRKMLLVFVVVFFVRSGTMMQLAVGLAVVTAAFMLHALCKPYDSAELNGMEGISLLVVLCTYYTGLLLATDSMPVTTGRALSIAVLMMNMIAMFYFSSKVAATFVPKLVQQMRRQWHVLQTLKTSRVPLRYRRGMLWWGWLLFTCGGRCCRRHTRRAAASGTSTATPGMAATDAAALAPSPASFRNDDDRTASQHSRSSRNTAAAASRATSAASMKSPLLEEGLQQSLTGMEMLAFAAPDAAAPAESEAEKSDVHATLGAIAVGATTAAAAAAASLPPPQARSRSMHAAPRSRRVSTRAEAAGVAATADDEGLWARLWSGQSTEESLAMAQARSASKATQDTRQLRALRQAAATPEDARTLNATSGRLTAPDEAGDEMDDE